MAFVVEIQWPLSGTTVAQIFQCNVAVRNEDDIAAPPTADYKVVCTLTRPDGTAVSPSQDTAPFDANNEPDLLIPMSSDVLGLHKLSAVLVRTNTTPPTELDADEEAGVNLTGSGPPARVTQFGITEE